MPKKPKKNNDKAVRAIASALVAYQSAHPKAKIDVYRQNSVSVRIRIVDPDFRALDLVDRDSKIWEILHRLPDDVQAEITMVLLLTPAEKKKSFANVEFEDPIPSAL